jgi:hypothetical protein
LIAVTVLCLLCRRYRINHNFARHSQRKGKPALYTNSMQFFLTNVMSKHTQNRRHTLTLPLLFFTCIVCSVEVLLTPRNGHHPYIQGNYKTCSTIQHQVSVKNYASQKDIQDVMDMLHSRSGRKITKITTPVLTDTPSIQGVWTPFLSLVNEQPKITLHGDAAH